MLKVNIKIIIMAKAIGSPTKTSS